MQVQERINEKLREAERYFKLAERSTILPAGFRPPRVDYNPCAQAPAATAAAADAPAGAAQLAIAEAQAACAQVKAASKQRKRSAEKRAAGAAVAASGARAGADTQLLAQKVATKQCCLELCQHQCS